LCGATAATGIHGGIDLAQVRPNGQVLLVSGWAADVRDGAPVQKVEILLDGKVVASAKLGLARKDVAQSFQRAEFTKSGWVAEADIRGLRSVDYQLSVRATNRRGQTVALSAGKWANLRLDPPALIQGGVDMAKVAQTRKLMDVAGWAADSISGAPVRMVEIAIDGKPLAKASLGIERKDVARAMQRPDYLKSGWFSRIDVSGLSSGPHTLTVLAWNNQGQKAELSPGGRQIVVP
jgi:hypothetical protein